MRGERRETADMSHVTCLGTCTCMRSAVGWGRGGERGREGGERERERERERLLLHTHTVPETVLI